MTSLRSHFRQHLKQGDPASSKTKSASSRIPTKSSNVEVEKPAKPTHTPAKLSKKPSKSKITSERKPGKDAAPVPELPQAHRVFLQSKRLSVTQSDVSLASRRLSSSILPAPPAIRTPSLVSGSSVSPSDSPKSTGLRRKPSVAIDRFVAQRQAEAERKEAGSVASDSHDAFDDSVLGISFPRIATYNEKSASTTDIPAYGGHGLPAEDSIYRGVTPSSIAPSTTPSTRFTDSPFSHAPTPSSMSSYSPGLSSVSGPITRPRPSSPTRTKLPLSHRPPPRDTVSRTNSARSRDVKPVPAHQVPPRSQTTGGLATVRESSTSSSSSTIARPSTGVNISHQQSASSSPSKLRSRRLSKTSSPLPVVAKPPIEVPPEFAHLNVDITHRPVTSDRQPPVRPSRDNTPDLVGMEQQANVVQSDLPKLYTTYHKRTPSQETPTSASSPSLKTRFGFSPKSSSLRDESPRIDSAMSPSPVSHSYSRESTPDITSDGAPLRRRDSPAVVPSSPSKRFGFFSRKSKPETVKTTEKPKRPPTKGPVAGTGHEGYGRFGVRGRSGSSTSSNGIRSPSIDSAGSYAPRPVPVRQGSQISKTSSETDLDDFLKERLNPVILRGSGSSISRTVSASDVPSSITKVPSSETSSLESNPPPKLLPSAMQHSRITSPTKPGALGRRRPSDSSDDSIAIRYPSRLKRVSVAASSVTSTTSTGPPQPKDIGISKKKESSDSFDTNSLVLTRTESDQHMNDDSLHGREGLWLRSPSVEPPQPARKLNFFQRALAAPRIKGKERAIDPEDRRASSSRSSITPYGMLDPVHPVEMLEVRRMIAEADTSAEESTSEGHLSALMVPYENRHTSLMPSPSVDEYSQDSYFRAKPIPPRIKVERQNSAETPELLHARRVVSRSSAQVVNIPRSPSMRSQHAPTVQDPMIGTGPALTASKPPQATLSTPEMQDKEFSKQPRLSPVGRIPKVVSKRDRDRKLPDNSFSRPFARHQPRPSSVKPPGSVYTQIREMASPIESSSQGSSQPVSSTSAPSDEISLDPNSSVFTQPTSVSTTRNSMDFYGHDEFLAMPRKDSDISFTTSSGNPSWLGSLFVQPQQEDIWNEYNDFMDEVMPTYPKTPTTGSSLGAPFQYANVLSDDPRVVMHLPYYVGPAPTVQLPMLPGTVPVHTVVSVPRQVSHVLHPPLTPLTPNTIMGLIGGYGDRGTSSIYVPNRASLQPIQRSHLPQPARSSLVSARNSVSSSRYSRSSTRSRAASLPDSNARSSQGSFSGQAGKSNDGLLNRTPESVRNAAAAKLAHLRRAALLTSKWLSFGQVLFSHARNELQFAEQEHRVLVLDGLSCDWSYFVALTYPSATVYNLNLASSSKTNTLSWPDAERAPPSNHRDIPLSSIAASFPFPKGFFTAVVLRFPPASSEAAYQACVSECKRVLRPGGYLEVSVLDLDLNHMSTKARKAVRDLKIRMQHRDRDICLQNASDVFVRLIGRRGFESVQQCIVRPPAAGSIPRSRDGSSISSASDGPGRPVWQRPDRGPTATETSLSFSFADLLEDTAAGPNANAAATPFAPGTRIDDIAPRMVDQVGRWWYSACYERAEQQQQQRPPGDRSSGSIWNDVALLRECEREGTTFRLLICHAQKPAQTRRRTVSV